MAPNDADDRPLRRRARKIALVLSGVVLATLLSGFLATRSAVARAEEAFPPTGSFIEVEGLRQHYIERGSPDKPAVVLVHGAFGGLQDYEATVLDELATRYRCIAWDRPGHGYSERPDEVADPGVQARILLGLVRALGLDDPMLVGFSYGGAVVLAAALEDSPPPIRGIVMLNGPSHTWPDPTLLEYRLPAFPLVGWLATETVIAPLGLALAGDGIANAFAPEPVAEGFREASPLGLALRPASYRANAEDVRVLKPFFRRVEARYREIAVPVTMLVSEEDGVVSPTIHSLQLEKVVKEFEMVRLEGAGHQVLYSRPAEVVRVIDGAMGR